DGDLGQEALDFAAHVGGDGFDRFGGGEHALRRTLRFGRGAGDFAQYRDDQLGAVGGADDVLRNFAGRHALLLDGLRNRGRVIVELAHAVRDTPDGLDRLAGGVLHFHDLAGNFLGRL